MKKKVACSFLCCLLALNLFGVAIQAEVKNRKEVVLEKCVDGDTAHFMIGNKKIKARFLAIDAPEISGTPEPFGLEASEYACSLLEGADQIEIAYDTKSDKQDKYGRDLVWVYVDGKLLQEIMVDEGLAEVAYIYGEYEYVGELQRVEKRAKSQHVGIWGDYDNSYDIVTIIEIVIIVLLLFTGLNKRTRNKLLKRLKQLTNK